MGLLDSIIGNIGGAGAARGSSSSPTSPLVKAILLLLAAKAAQSVTSRSSAQTDPVQHSGRGDLSPSDASGGPPGGLGGGLSGGLGGLLGGLVGGAGAGGLLGGLLDQLRGSGLGDQVDSWIGTGQNKPVAPHDMAHALGPDTISELEQHTGLSRDQLLQELSQELPASVDHVTPGGRVPDDSEIWSGKPA